MTFNGVRGGNKIKNIVALTIGVFFAVVISETTLQILDIPPRPVSGWLNCKKTHPGLCNNLGFRGREFVYSPDDFVVIVLGDSEAYTMLPAEQMPERRLEQYLKQYRENVKVFTIADMGYGQDQQYLALRQYFEKYRADLVLLMFTVRNDMEDNIFPISGSNKTVKPTFWLENNELFGPSEGWLEPVGPRMKLALFASRFLGKSMGESRLEMWQKGILPPFYQGLEHYEGEVDYSWHEMWVRNPQEAFKGLEFEKAGHAGTELAPKSELRRYGISLTRKLFSEMKQLIDDNHAHFIIFKEERPWEVQYVEKEKVYYLKGKYYKLSVSQHRDTLKELFNGFEHYRFPLNMDNYTVSEKDEHLNQAAIEKLMRNW